MTRYVTTIFVLGKLNMCHIFHGRIGNPLNGFHMIYFKENVSSIILSHILNKCLSPYRQMLNLQLNSLSKNYFKTAAFKFILNLNN